MIRIQLVYRYQLVRSGIRRLLEDQGDMQITVDTGDAEQAVRAARRAAPEVVLLDLDVPGLGGIEATRRIQSVAPGAKIIAMGVHLEGPIPASVLQVGARGYLTKDCDQEEMIAAIRKVHAGRRYIATAVAQGMALERLAPASTPMGALTPRELTVMVMVSQGHDRRTISSRLCLSPKTVSTYRARIMRKLGTSSDVELTHLSFHHGLVEPGQVAEIPA